MGFTPTILVNFDELLAKRPEIESAISNESNGEDIIQANESLLEAIKWADEHGYVQFDKHKLNLVIIDSDLTSRNSDIREELFDMGVEYQISN